MPEEMFSEERHCLPTHQCREHTWGCLQCLTARPFIAGEKGAQGQGSASRCRRGREEGTVPFHPQDELKTIDLLQGPPGSCDQGLGSILRPEGSAPSTSGEIMVQTHSTETFLRPPLLFPGLTCQNSFHAASDSHNCVLKTAIPSSWVWPVQGPQCLTVGLSK